MDRNESFVLTRQVELAQRAHEQGRSVVLVHDATVVGFFESEIEATKEGFRLFGREDPFYVQVVSGPDCLRVVASNFSRC